MERESGCLYFFSLSARTANQWKKGKGWLRFVAFAREKNRNHSCAIFFFHSLHWNSARKEHSPETDHEFQSPQCKPCSTSTPCIVDGVKQQEAPGFLGVFDEVYSRWNARIEHKGFQLRKDLMQIQSDVIELKGKQASSSGEKPHSEPCRDSFSFFILVVWEPVHRLLFPFIWIRLLSAGSCAFAKKAQTSDRNFILFGEVSQNLCFLISSARWHFWLLMLDIISLRNVFESWWFLLQKRFQRHKTTNPGRGLVYLCNYFWAHISFIWSVVTWQTFRPQLFWEIWNALVSHRNSDLQHQNAMFGFWHWSPPSISLSTSVCFSLQTKTITCVVFASRTISFSACGDCFSVIWCRTRLTFLMSFSFSGDCFQFTVVANRRRKQGQSRAECAWFSVWVSVVMVPNDYLGHHGMRTVAQPSLMETLEHNLSTHGNCACLQIDLSETSAHWW